MFIQVKMRRKYIKNKFSNKIKFLVYKRKYSLAKTLQIFKKYLFNIRSAILIMEEEEKPQPQPRNKKQIYYQQ